jgi:hypothetical protein
MRKLVLASVSLLAVGAAHAQQQQQEQRQGRNFFGYTNDTAIDGSEVIGPIRAHGADKSVRVDAIAAFANAAVPGLITAAINAQVPAIVTSQIPDVLTAAPSITQALAHTFWEPTAHVNRFADRVFMGSAVEATHLCQTCGGSHDWFENIAFSGTSYNGGPPVYSDGPFAQVYILADPNSATAIGPTPAVALAVAAETISGVNGSTVRGMDLTVINNATSGQNPGAWGLYLEAHHVGTSTANTYGIELEMRNSSNLAHWDPYFTTPGAAGTVGLDLGCGAGLPAVGQHDCTAAMVLGANPMPWSTGLLFFPGSVAASGPGLTHPAIALPSNYAMQWYTGPNTLGGSLTGDASGGLHVGGINMIIETGYLGFGVIPVGVPSLYACFSAAGVLIASTGPCL